MSAADEDRFPDVGGLLTRYRLADLIPKFFTISNVRSILARGHRLVMVYEPGRVGMLNVVADDITVFEMFEIETIALSVCGCATSPAMRRCRPIWESGSMRRRADDRCGVVGGVLGFGGRARGEPGRGVSIPASSVILKTGVDGANCRHYKSCCQGRGPAQKQGTDTMITKPQATFLAAAMRQPITAYGSDYKVAGNLRAAGLICEAGKAISHSTLFAPTKAGLTALRDFRAARFAKHGCMAYLDDLREAEEALAAA